MTKDGAELPAWMFACVNKAPDPDTTQITNLRAIFRPDPKTEKARRATRKAA